MSRGTLGRVAEPGSFEEDSADLMQPMLLIALVLPSVSAWHALAPVVQRRCSDVTMLTDQEERVSAAMEIKPVNEESARATGLALALDDGTRKSHSMAENTAFVTGFFKGISTRPAFAQLVASLYFVYEAMESAFAQATDPSVKALDYPELRRVSALEEDMAYYFGDDWRNTGAC